MNKSVRLVTALVVAGLLGLAAWWLVSALVGGKRAEQVAKVEAGRADAATKSGQDAVGTVGQVGARDGSADDQTRRNGDAIDKASGAAAPIPGAVAGAGRDGLCQRRAYRCTPDCLQRAAARGVAGAGAGCPASR